MTAPQVVVNGKMAGGQQPSAVVVLAQPYATRSHVLLAESFVETVTGMAASTWTDGTGTVSVTASGKLVNRSRHTHTAGGQTLTHAHPGGHRAHGYFQHPEDARKPGDEPRPGDV